MAQHVKIRAKRDKSEILVDPKTLVEGERPLMSVHGDDSWTGGGGQVARKEGQKTIGRGGNGAR